MTDGIEVEQTRRVEDRRGVRVEVALERPIWGDEKLTLFVSSSRVDGGDWSPPTVSIGFNGQSGFAIEDWPAIRDGIDRALAAFRALGD
jgi:hypothetical protein